MILNNQILGAPQFHQIKLIHYTQIKSTVKMIRPLGMCKLENIGNTFRLTLTNCGNEDQHRLNPSLISSIRDQLYIAKAQATENSVLITSAEGVSFSRGFDFSYARAGGSDEAHEYRYREMIEQFKHVVTDLISLPMPTIAAINGGATGAGLMLGISHDYLAMKPRIGYLRLEHLSQKMSLPPYFAALIRSKVGSPWARHRLVLRDLQFYGHDALGIGLLDKENMIGNDDVNAVDAVEVETLAGKLSKLEWNGKVYAELRKALYPELCKELGLV